MADIDRIHGAHGDVKMDPLGGTALVAVASLNKWDLDMSTDKVKMTAFHDTNQVYRQGLPDIKGTYAGWYDPADGTVIFDAVFGTAIPSLELYPSSLRTEKFAGKALLDCHISVDANGGVAVSGAFVAAGSWALPTWV